METKDPGNTGAWEGRYSFISTGREQRDSKTLLNLKKEHYFTGKNNKKRTKIRQGLDKFIFIFLEDVLPIILKRSVLVH